MIKSTNEVKLYAKRLDDGLGEIDCSFYNEHITVKNHYNDTNRVVLCVDNKEYTVIAKDLMAAISNATNVNRWD